MERGNPSSPTNSSLASPSSSILRRSTDRQEPKQVSFSHHGHTKHAAQHGSQRKDPGGSSPPPYATRQPSFSTTPSLLKKGPVAKRELSHLQAETMRHNPPPLMPILVTALKDKRVAKTRWQKRRFPVTARNDELKMELWVKMGAADELNQPFDAFAKFNKKSKVIGYTDQEYQDYLVQLQPYAVMSPFPGTFPLSANGQIDPSCRPAPAMNTSTPAEIKLDPSREGTAFTSTAAPGSPASASRSSAALRASSPIKAAAAGTASGSVSPSPKVSNASPLVVAVKASPTRTALAAQPTQPLNNAPGNLSVNGVHPAVPKKYSFAPWTKEDTDILFKLCAEYDLRFFVIHDRWPDTCAPRTLDELKDRYYSVVKRLVEVRTRLRGPAVTSVQMSGALMKHVQGIIANPFDVEYELTRKAQTETQLRRDKRELLEEEEIVAKARSIEANRKRIIKEKQRMQKLLNISPEALLAVQESVASRAAAFRQAGMAALAAPKGFGTVPAVSPIMLRQISLGAAGVGSSTTAAATAATAAADGVLTGTQLLASGVAGFPEIGAEEKSYLVRGILVDSESHPGLPCKAFSHRKAPNPAYMRSSFIFTPISQSSKVSKRVEAHSDILKIPLRPMATGTILDEYDLLRLETLSFLELHRVVLKKEEEVYNLRQKLAKLTHEALPESKAGAHKKRKLDELYHFTEAELLDQPDPADGDGEERPPGHAHKKKHHR